MQEMRIPTLKCRFYLLDRWGTCTYTGSKWSFFRCLEVLGGTFVRTHMSQSCLGCIVEVFCVIGMQEMRIPTLKCRFYLFDRWGTCTYTGSKGSFFRCLEALEGTFVRIHMSVGRQSGRCSLMWTSHGSQPFRRYIVPYLCFGSKMSVYGQK